jgi:hypothetical protein
LLSNESATSWLISVSFKIWKELVASEKIMSLTLCLRMH